MADMATYTVSIELDRNLKSVKYYTCSLCAFATKKLNGIKEHISLCNTSQMDFSEREHVQDRGSINDAAKRRQKQKRWSNRKAASY